MFSIWAAALRMQKKFKGANRRFARAYELAPVQSEPLEQLEPGDLDDLIAFLQALNDGSSQDLRDTVPMDGVPSGLPLYD